MVTILPLTSFLERPFVRQTILALCVSMSFFCIGLVRGYSASAIPSINELRPELLPTKNIASWAGSIPPLGAFCGSLLAAPLLHLFGRKFVIILASPLWTLAWITIGLSEHWKMVVMGRLLSGFCVGLCLSAAQIYVSECCDPKIRGVLGSLPSIFMSFGILVAYIIGSLVDWDTLAWCSSVVSMFLCILMNLIPDSPVWLRSRNQFRAADKATEWLKLTTTSIPLPPPAKSIDTVAMRGFENMNGSKDDKSDRPHSLSVLFSRPCIRPLLIGMTLLILQQVSGIDSIIFFTVEIFRASGSSIDGHVATIIVGLVQLLSNIASLFVVDKFGRKPLLISSAVVMSVSMASMGTAFYLNDSGNTSFGFLPLGSLIVFMIGFSIGFGCIPFLLLGELFPAPQRSFLSSIAGSFNLGIMFIVIKTYHYLEAMITTAGTFWMYSGFCAVAIVFVIFAVPETKGRDLDSIAKLFVKKPSNENTDEKRLPSNSNEKRSEGTENPMVSLDDEATNL